MILKLIIPMFLEGLRRANLNSCPQPGYVEHWPGNSLGKLLGYVACSVPESQFI